MNRREFLKLALGGSALMALPACAYADGSAPARVAPAGLIKGRWVSPPDCYFAYPHKNGFIPGGDELVIAGFGAERINFEAWSYRTGAVRTLINISRGGAALWADIAQATGQLTVVRDRYEIVVLDTSGNSDPRVVYAAPDDRQIGSRFAAFRPDGKTILFATRARTPQPDAPLDTLCEVDVATGRVQELASVRFPTDHYHYSPFDPAWVAFCHNAPLQATDRIWGLNRVSDQGPAALWNQQTPTGALYVGHERWAFERAGAYAVAYGSSPGKPSGLYFADAVAKRAVLVSESRCFLHCNVDHAGKWAVVDTANMAYRAPGETAGPLREADGRSIADIVLVNVQTGKQYWVARSHMKDHPFHAHPHLSADGGLLVYNDYQADGAGTPSRTIALELDLSALG